MLAASLLARSKLPTWGSAGRGGVFDRNPKESLPKAPPMAHTIRSRTSDSVRELSDSVRELSPTHAVRELTQFDGHTTMGSGFPHRIPCAGDGGGAPPRRSVP